MHEIKCPHCGKAFKIDEAGYANILKQVRDREFEKQLHERLELAEREKQTAIELATTKVTSALLEAAAKKDAEILKLQTQIGATGTEKQLAVTEAVRAIEKQRDELKSALDRAALEKELAAKALMDK